MAVQSPLIELKMRKEDANDPRFDRWKNPWEKTASNKKAQGLTLDFFVICYSNCLCYVLAFTLSWESCFL